jgi:transcriptional regulator with XRE-family HTH domain
VLAKENEKPAKMLATVDTIVFSDWLNQQLIMRGWSQADLSKAAGISRASITNVLTGTRQPGPDLCNAIAQAFKIPPEDVFRAAGLLPPKKEDAPGLAEWMHLYMNATPSQREEMLDYARFKARQDRNRPAENS